MIEAARDLSDRRKGWRRAEGLCQATSSLTKGRGETRGDLEG